MRIERLEVYTADLSYAGQAYAFAGGRSYQQFTSTVVVVKTDAGIEGYGEVCPCGPSYMPAFSGGLLSCLNELAPAVVGEDPRHLTRLMRTMDQALNGHAYAKAAIDIACWDVLGKVTGQPVYVLLGGLLTGRMPLHRVVPLARPEETLRVVNEHRRAGFRHFQVKLGQSVEADTGLLRTLAETFRPDEVWMGDANCAWRRDQAVSFSKAMADVEIFLEQPCPTYEECLSVRRRVPHPIKLDECLTCLGDFQRALRDDAMDAAALKVSKFGGITPARIIRDLCVSAGISLTIEDAWGSGIATAAYAHLAASTPPQYLLNTTDLHNYNTVQLAHGSPETSNGQMTLSDRPGLGVEPDFGQLGEPVAVLE